MWSKLFCTKCVFWYSRSKISLGLLIIVFSSQTRSGIHWTNTGLQLPSLFCSRQGVVLLLWIFISPYDLPSAPTSLKDYILFTKEKTISRDPNHRQYNECEIIYVHHIGDILNVFSCAKFENDFKVKVKILEIFGKLLRIEKRCWISVGLKKNWVIDLWTVS